ncbi:hypothetical protein EFP18_25500 [Burkholderia glumae]|uniref:hypothetical protein n=1 Tax=Burkholderia glumae TaxID=337 RepID=UPI0003A981DB|nr:hypothetical protein [Burkholderia glumae]MCM2493238.1 hypothetical protein [Burkholderia glumae]MCM2546122.1 hypothetical protein [Burkholderia glumae]MCM2551925.1 hypothetical protein [Burkholderia glumae]MCQ0033868.1 hypothetical protein [Burkholderia glumae]MCQ0037315.1 hypothetical protein [Burkholderia glumae]
MKLIARIALAFALTLPVEAAITSLPWMEHWFGNGGEGWNVMAPLFRALGSAGGERNEDIFVGVLLLVSFAVAFLLSIPLIAGLSRLRGRPKHQQ